MLDWPATRTNRSEKRRVKHETQRNTWRNYRAARAGDLRRHTRGMLARRQDFERGLEDVGRSTRPRSICCGRAQLCEPPGPEEEKEKRRREEDQ
mmetsp:Transcript_53663/g.144689  ORF Transcript_53663/g.144689 Transcript_53663/m.144689 type:complete len:94 (+) Transcript_53663:28-309(+)